MNNLKMVSKLLAVAGVLLLAYTLVGRFVGGRTVLGAIIPGGMAASTAAIGANSLLLLAIIASLFSKE